MKAEFPSGFQSESIMKDIESLPLFTPPQAISFKGEPLEFKPRVQIKEMQQPNESHRYDQLPQNFEINGVKESS